MREVACAYKLQPLDFRVAPNFFYGHLFACGSAEAAVNVKVSDYSDLTAPPFNVPVLVMLLVIEQFDLKGFMIPYTFGILLVKKKKIRPEAKLRLSWQIWRGILLCEDVACLSHASVFPGALPSYPVGYGGAVECGRIVDCDA